eukprot:759181-Pelagomonas_calceolata.AAC.6
MVTMGGDLQPGRLADRLLAGLSQPDSQPGAGTFQHTESKSVSSKLEGLHKGYKEGWPTARESG